MNSHHANPLAIHSSRASGLLGLGLLAWLVLILWISLLLLYALLRSPLLHSQVWPYLQPMLEEQLGMDIDLRDVRLDMLLGHLELHGVAMRERSAPNANCPPMQLQTEALSLRLAPLALLQRTVKMDHLHLKHTRILQCVEVRAAVPPSGPDVPMDLPQLLQPWLNWLDHPPLTFQLEDLRITDLRVDLQVHHPQQSIHWQGRLDTSATVRAEPGRLSGQWNMLLQSEQPLTMRQTIHQAHTSGPYVRPIYQAHMSGPYDEALEIALQPDLTTDLHWEINRQEGVWVLVLDDVQMELQVHNLRLDTGQQVLAIPHYVLQFASTQTQARLHDYWPMTLAATLHSHAPRLGLVWHVADQPPLQVDVQHHLMLDIAGRIDLLNPVPAALHLQLDSEHQIAEWHGRWQEQDWHLGATQLHLQAQATGLEDWHAQARLHLHLPHSPWHQTGTEPQLLTPLAATLVLHTQAPGTQVALDLDLAPFVLQAAPLQSPLPLALALQTQVDLAAWQIAQQGQLHLAASPLLDWQLTGKDQAGQAHLAATLALEMHPALETYLAALAPLSSLGPLHTQHRLEARLDYPAPRLLDWLQPNNSAIPDLKALPITATWHGGLTQRDPQPSRPILWTEPLQWYHTLHWNGTQAAVQAHYILPHLSLPERLALEALEVRLDGQLPWPLTGSSLQAQLTANHRHLHLHLPEHLLWSHGQTDLRLQLTPQANHWQIATQLHGQGRQLRWLPKTTEWAGLVFPLQLDGEFVLDHAIRQLEIDTLELSVADWFTQDLAGGLDLDGQTVLLTGTTVITGHDAVLQPWREGASSRGQLRLPWQLNRIGGQQISLSTEAHFSDWHLDLPPLRIEGLSGHITLDQDLELTPDNTLRFSYLLTPETFQRVDFNRVAPFLGGRDAFTMQQMTIGPHHLGPLRATVPIAQNLLRIQDFRLALLGGDMAGQFYLDITPGAWRLGLLSRIRQLDVRPLLPEHLQRSEATPVNARTAVELDLNRRLLEGRIDITEINRAQLLQLLDLLDPDQRDAQLGRARSALRLAHPRWLTAEMQYGLLDLSLGLSIFDEPIHVRGLPLSPIIARFAAELVALPERVPLESR